MRDVFDGVHHVQSLTSKHTCVPPSCFLLQTLRLADFMMKKTMGFPSTSTSTAASAGADDSDASPMAWIPVPVTPPRPLDLALSPASLRAIATAEVAFDQLVDDHEVCVCVSERDRERVIVESPHTVCCIGGGRGWP